MGNIKMRNPVYKLLVFLFFPILMIVSHSGYSQSGLLHKWSHVLNNDAKLGGEVIPGAMAEDSSGNIWFVGNYRKHIAFDPASGLHEWEANPGFIFNGFIAKYNAEGNFLLAKEISGQITGSSIYIQSIAISPENEILVSGFLSGTIDFDKENPSNPLEIVNVPSAFFAKYSANGQLMMYKILSGNVSGTGSFSKIMPLPSGDFVVAGFTSGRIDLDPGPNVVTSAYIYDNTFFAWYNKDGNFLRGHMLAGSITSFDLKGAGLDKDGNLHLAGTHDRNAIDFDPGPGTAYVQNNFYGRMMVFAKYNSNGNFVYVKGVGQFADVEVLSASLDTSGHFNIVCSPTGPTDFDPGPNNYQISAANTSYKKMCVARYNTSGTFVSAAVLATTTTTNSEDRIIANSIETDADGNFIMAGFFFGSYDFDPGPNQRVGTAPFSNQRMFVAKYSKSGSLLFADFPINPDEPGFGNPPDDVKCLMADSKGRIWMAGVFSGCIQFGPNTDIISGFSQLFFVRYSGNMNAQFAKKIGRYPSEEANDEGEYIIADKEGNIYVTGTFAVNLDADPSDEKIILEYATQTPCLGPTFVPQIFIAKYNKDGKLLFAKTLTGSGFKQVTGFTLDSTGNILIAGWFGNELITNTLSGDVSLQSNGERDIFYAKFTSTGENILLQNIGGSGWDECFQIASDKDDNILITGMFTGLVDFDPGPNTSIQNSGENYNLFVAKYNPQGAFVFAKKVITTPDYELFEYNYIKSITSDDSGNIYTTGCFNSTINFENGNPNAYLTNSARISMFFAKLSPSGQFLYIKKIAHPSFSTISETEPNRIVTKGQNVYIIGRLRGMTDFNPGAASNTESSGDENYYNGFIARYNSDGNFNQVRVVKTNEGWSELLDLKVYNNGNILTTGYNWGSTKTINFSNTTFTGKSFITKFDSALHLVHATGFEVPYLKSAVSINGYMYTTGHIEADEIYDMDPGPLKNEVLAKNGKEIFIAKFTDCGSVHRTISNGSWHNPATWQNGSIPSEGSCIIVSHNISLSQNTYCRTLTIQPGGNVSVAPGIILNITE